MSNKARPMTVKELIQELSKIKDQTKEVVFIDGDVDLFVCTVDEQEDQVNLHETID